MCCGFLGAWCGPCRVVGPVIEELSNEYAGKVNFYEVNTDEGQELRGRLRDSKHSIAAARAEVGATERWRSETLPKNALKEAIERQLLAAGR